MISKLLLIKSRSILLFVFLCIVQSIFIQAQSVDGELNLDTIKAGKFDTGKMWTFENPPVEYFVGEYNFNPEEEWFTNLRLSTLKFADYCSASFISEDGLIMTNHHCARESVTEVTAEDEDLYSNGFIAETLADERPVPGLFVDQLILIEDVTDEIFKTVENAETEKQRIEMEEKIIIEIEEKYSEQTGLVVLITPLYNGARYSLYGYKRYEDVRLVFVPEFQLGAFGGDYDNFTYPRYNLDCAFFRAYDEEGNPVKIKNYLKWSKNGAVDGEPVFVIGNPGTTDRLKTITQLEYLRDNAYPATIEFLNSLIETYIKMIEEEPEQKAELNDHLLSLQNSLKAYSGMLAGLKDPVLMQRKKDFENNFRQIVLSETVLNNKYGDIWKKIEQIYYETQIISEKYEALNVNSFDTPEYFFIADELLMIAEELKYPEDERSEIYVGEELDSTISSLIPQDFNFDYNNELLKAVVDNLYKSFGSDDELVKNFTYGNEGQEAVEYILSNSSITTLDGIKSIVDDGYEAIENSDDPFIRFITEARNREDELSERLTDLSDLEEVYNQQLGKALFEVYGTSIPPDATFTLRISDGIVQGFSYNGTTAPVITTFYGMYDRYYSFENEYPWSLPERWLDLPSDFDLSTPFNFISTNDFTGGSSGSPIVNRNSEIVGVSFDGNIQGLPGSFIYRSEDNRTVSVHSKGMMEAIRLVYKFERLADELETGRIQE
ncbi:MAG TPA: S46 family peptidase [Ignavibacteriaceae bacterium]|nr:S46 family peptidase [Ignavibacteriaceae bacterium]